MPGTRPSRIGSLPTRRGLLPARGCAAGEPVGGCQFIGNVSDCRTIAAVVVTLSGWGDYTVGGQTCSINGSYSYGPGDLAGISNASACYWGFAPIYHPCGTIQNAYQVEVSLFDGGVFQPNTTRISAQINVVDRDGQLEDYFAFTTTCDWEEVPFTVPLSVDMPPGTPVGPPLSPTMMGNVTVAFF